MPSAGIPGLRAELIDNIIGHHAYGVNLWVDESAAGFNIYDLRDRLVAGDSAGVDQGARRRGLHHHSYVRAESWGGCHCWGADRRAVREVASGPAAVVLKSGFAGFLGFSGLS